MGRFLLRRLPRQLLVLFAILVFNFLLLHAAPGDLVDVLAGQAGASDTAYVEALRSRLGLDQSLPVQFWHYVSNLAHLDLGTSPRFNEPVLDLILERAPATFLLLGTSMTLAVCLGLLLGGLAARRPNSWSDDAVSVLSLLFYATPVFCVGLLLIVVFAVKLRWLPSGGLLTIGGPPLGPGATVLDIARHLVLPAFTLALFYVAIYTRLVRASMLEVQRLDFVRTARAKGMTERAIARRHVLRNALLPLVTMVGMQSASAMGGSVLVETIFGWPGLGRLAFEAISQRDVNLLLGLLILSSVLVVVVNLVIDLVYARLDPRIELA